MENLPERVQHNHDSGIKNENFNLNSVKNWEEREDGTVCIKKIEVSPTASWREGWYKNPTSGRSYNYGINTENPQEHSTVIVKGGSFFVDKKIKDFFLETSTNLDELYGGMTFKSAKKEYDVAVLIQEKFKSLLNKKANCPEPLDVKPISHILDEKNKTVELLDFFKNELKKEGDIKFTFMNFLRTAAASGIDISYPLNKEAGAEVKKDPSGWLIKECLEKNQQGVYRYKIEGPNTRLLDLMTLNLADRQEYFIKANNATNTPDAVDKFAAKLGEFYGVLQKNGISYHSGHSEHCTLVDTTISGMVMDIGGLSTEEDAVKKKDPKHDLYELLGMSKKSDGASMDQSEAYTAQIIRTTNLLSYLCKNILKTDPITLMAAHDVFWRKYKNLYSDKNIEYFSNQKNIYEPEKIRTEYFNSLTGDWIKLAPDIKRLSHKG